MRVFVSWSGDRSKAAALGLRSLLEATFPEVVDVFISDQIDAGEMWALRLETELKQSEFGVVCLTEDNFQVPWLLFEAGAIATKFGRARVVPYWIDDLPVGAEKSPLAHFQRMPATHEGTLGLLKSINAARETPRDSQKLAIQFDRWWPDLEKILKCLHAGEPANARSERELWETILRNIGILMQAHHGSTGSHLSLPSEELAHLLNLRHQPTITYSLHSNLLKELRHLRDLGLIQNKQGPIGDLPRSFVLSQYFELSEAGRDHLLQSGVRKPSP